MKKNIFAIICFLVAFCTEAQQVRYVKQGGVGDGSSWANASGNLQSMINASSSGDEVWVAAGTYQRGAGQFFSMKEGVEIYGGFPSNNNAADMDDRNWNQNQTILLGNGRSVIRNVFTSSTAMTSDTVLDGFIITGNNVQVTDNGAGIFNRYASPTLRNLIIRNNRSSGNGGGLYNNSSYPTVVNTLISNNRANYGAGVLNLGAGGQSIFVNVTIVSNQGGGVRNNSNTNSIFRNTIITGNVSPNEKIIVNIDTVNTTPQYHYCFVQGVTTADANGNIDGNTNPLFVDTTSGNFNLTVVSPLVDAGDNSLYEGEINDDFDLGMSPRLSGGTIDIGAYETQEVYTGPSTIYVKSNATGNNDGSSWTDAYTDFQQAINASLYGDQIWVAAGTYQCGAGQFFSMKEGVEIYGGFPNDDDFADMNDRDWNQHQTILLGNGRSVIRNVFTTSTAMTSDTVLDGFIITGNNVQVADEGAGIYNRYASPILRNLIIRNNRSTPRGGGMFNYNSSPIVYNVLFTENRSNQGSAIENRSNSAPIFINVTVAGHTTGNSLIRTYSNSNSTFRNSVISGNTASLITNSSGGTATYQYSLVQGVTTADANGNIDGNTNPWFASPSSGNFNLTGASPLVDAGDNSLYEGEINDDFDLGMSPRLSGGTIDIGAYEYQGCSEIVTWNGTSWSQAPTLNNLLIINGDLTIDSNLEGCNLTVISGNVIVNPGQTVTLFNEINVSGGSFTLRNQASLVQINDVENFGEITVEKTTKPMDASNYGYWSSPVEGWRLNELSPLTSAPYFYSWNVAGQSWTQHSGGNQVMEEGNGYIVRAPSTAAPQVYNFTFEGVPNNGNVDINISGGGNFNFLGNPYPSAINIESFLADPDNSELSKIVYLWTNGYQIVNGNYVYQYEGFATYNAVGGAGETQSPTDQTPTAMIASGQAFFITGNSNGVATFKNEHRVVGNNNNFFNRLISNDKHRFWLNLESSRGYFAQTLVGYLDGASNGKDKDIDAALLESEASLQVYSLLDNERNIIQGRALPFDTEDSFPIGYTVKFSGTYAISLANYDGLFAEGQDIFIKDNLLNITHNLKDGNYEFETQEGAFDNRFEIVYRKSLDVVNNTADWQVYKKDNQFNIESSADMKAVNVYDMLGRLVYEANDINSQSFVIPEVQNQQILIIKVFFSNSESSVKKVNN